MGHCLKISFIDTAKRCCLCHMLNLELDYVKMGHSGNYNEMIYPSSPGIEYQKEEYIRQCGNSLVT